MRQTIVATLVYMHEMPPPHTQGLTSKNCTGTSKVLRELVVGQA